MIKTCAHLDSHYVDCHDGVIEWQCVDCGEVLEAFEDCCAGR